MTKNRLAVVLSSVLVGIGLVPVLGSAPALAATNPVVSDVQITGDLSLDLVKDDFAAVTVQARIVCATADGCVPWTEEDQLWHAPYLLVTTLTSGAAAPVARWVKFDAFGTGQLPHFRRVSGTDQDGVYRASVVFSALNNGSYRIDGIGYLGLQLQSLSSIPSAQRTVNVKGADPVIIRSHVDPGAVKTGASGSTTLSYLVQTRDSGRLRPDQTVFICDPDVCGDLNDWSTYRTTATTSSGFTPTFNGYGFFTYGANLAVFARTLPIDGQTELMRMGTASTFPTTQKGPSSTWANIKSSASKVSLGATITLSGSVGGNGSPTRPDTVIVQRWVGGKWSDLGRSLLLVNGRWSYDTKPQTTGNYQYRVVKKKNACAGSTCMSPQAISSTLKVKVG